MLKDRHFMSLLCSKGNLRGHMVSVVLVIVTEFLSQRCSVSSYFALEVNLREMNGSMQLRLLINSLNGVPKRIDFSHLFQLVSSTTLSGL